MNEVYRGSRKHILDWTDLEDDVFRQSLNELLDPSAARRKFTNH